MKREIIRVKLAKVAYCLSGWLMPIKTYRRTYEWTGSFDEDVSSSSDDFSYAGRAWLPCTTSLRLLELAERLDTVHFNHWAINHANCLGTECATCGGRVHPTVSINLNEEVTS